MLSGIMIPLMGMVDMAVVGRLPHSKAMGAVALGAWLFDLFYWSFGFLRMGTTGLSAQAFGRKDDTEVALQWARPAILAFGIGTLLLMSAQWYLNLMMPLLSPHDQKLNIICTHYFMARVWGGPAVLLNYVCVGWLLGVQKSKWVLYLQMGLATLNIILSIYWGQMMGVVGVAYASAIAQMIMALCATYLCYHHAKISSLPTLKQHLFKQKASWLALWRINRDLMLRSILLLLAFGAFHSVSVRQSADLLAANALLLHLQTLQAFVLDGFAHAMEAMIGQALGAKNKSQLNLNIRVGWEFSTLASLSIAGIYAIAFYWIIGCFTTHHEILAMAGDYKWWAVLSPICSAPCFLLDGIMIGATKSRIMFTGMMISVCLYMICLFTLPIYLNNHGIFLALMIFMLARAITLYPYSKIKLS